MLQVYKNTESFLLCLFFSTFRYILLYVFIILLYIFPQNFIFYHKIHTFNGITISFGYTHFWKKYAWRSNFFIIFVTNEICKILLTKRKLILDTTILLIFVYWWNSYSSISVSSNLIIFIIFYKFLHFLK